MSLKNSIYKQQTGGSITVFLSLILLLILSLLLTIIEGARVSTAKVYAERALSTSMDSIFADYYGPLWEEYHIFGYYPGEGNLNEVSELLSDGMKYYMSYTFEPEKDLENTYSTDFDNLFGIKLNSVSVSSMTSLTDYQGQLLINEAVDYMKYKELGNGAKLLLNKLSLLKTPEKVSYLFEEKQKAEEKLVEIDKEILNLMELLDGIKTSKKGIEVTKNGKLIPVDSFVKKICFGEITREAVGINQENVFLTLKDSYTDPVKYFNEVKTGFLSLEGVLKQIMEEQCKLVELQNNLSLKQAELDGLNAKSKKTKAEKKQIKELKKTIIELRSGIKYINSGIASHREEKQQLIRKIEKSRDQILQLTSSIKPKIEKAVSSMEGLLFKAETAAPFINHYEAILEKEKGLIDQKVYSGLEENLNEMKKYVSVDSNGYDFKGMKGILENDLTILNRVEEFLNQGKLELDSETFDKAESSFDNALAQMKNYQISGLTLDYSTLVLDRAAQKNPVSQVNDLLRSGITNMVMDSNLISDKTLKTELLPSEMEAMSGESTDFLSKLASFFQNASIGENKSDLSSFFGSFGNEAKILSMAEQGVNKLAEQVLFQEYLKEHFAMFSPEKESATEGKPSALSYEQEYLLAGYRADQDNLEAVTARIIFLRTILDFVSLLGDSAKRNEARLAATTLVGFTGLPFLVSITQVLILISWSFAEALLDVTAIMMGKEVPVFKNKTVLELPEIFLINRSFLQQKANGLKATNEISMSYQDYLRIFLLMKNKKDLAYRSMDLMQEDIKQRYETDFFSIDHCLYGYDTSADFLLKPKFTGIPLIQKYLGIGRNDLGFTATSSYCY